MIYIYNCNYCKSSNEYKKNLSLTYLIMEILYIFQRRLRITGICGTKETNRNFTITNPQIFNEITKNNCNNSQAAYLYKLVFPCA